MNIVIFVNKDFEYNGYIEGIDSRDYCTILDRVFEDTEARPNKMTPSRIYKFGDNAIRATEYCISYMFSDLKYTSSSEQKYKLLYELLSEKIDCIPDYVISVSTSESTPESQGGDSDTNSINGCVLLGNQFYARDCRDIDPGSGSNLVVSNKIEKSSIFYPDFYTDLDKDENKEKIQEGMKSVHNNPAKKLLVDVNVNNVSLGVINVIDYSKYGDADKATYESFKKLSHQKDIHSCLETTHAVVKMAVERYNKNIPVLFVSPITDRYLKFEEDVKGDQNKDCSYNAGVVVANLLDFIYNKLQ